MLLPSGSTPPLAQSQSTTGSVVGGGGVVVVPPPPPPPPPPRARAVPGRASSAGARAAASVSRLVIRETPEGDLVAPAPSATARPGLHGRFVLRRRILSAAGLLDCRGSLPAPWRSGYAAACKAVY